MIKSKSMSKTKGLLFKYLKRECDDKYGSFHVYAGVEKYDLNGRRRRPAATPYG